ncbi:MAG: hypothetical protein R3Y33_00890 [Clostridia bacterium]
MGLFGKLTMLAIAVGAGYATVKVAKKYDDNKKREILDGDIDEFSSPKTVDNVKKAVVEVYDETSEKVKTSVKNVADNIGIDTEEIGSAFSKAGDAAFEVGKAVANASVKVAEKVMKEAPAMIETAKVVVGTTAEQVKDLANKVGEKMHTEAEDFVEVEEAEEIDDDVVDVDTVEEDEEIE